MSTLSNALSGLSAAQVALANTANNVANVNTPGYSRKVVQQETRIIAGQGSGVRSLDLTRIADQFLNDEARDQATRLGRTDTLAKVHQRVQDTIYGEAGDTSRSISSKLTSLLTSIDALSATPEQAATRQQVVGQINDVLQTIDADLRTVQTFRRDADQQIKQVVGSINADLVELDVVNDQFTRGNGSAEMQDRRDQLLRSLAANIDIQVGWHDDGHVDVTTRSGIALIDGEPRAITYQPASSVAQEGSFGQIAVYAQEDIDASTDLARPGSRFDQLVTAGTRTTLTPELVAAGATPIVSGLRGGQLQGLIEARDKMLPDLADQLAELGSMLRFTLNSAHNQSASNPPPNQMVGSRSGQAGGDLFSGVGTATFALVNRTSNLTTKVFQIDLTTATSVASVMASITAASSGAATASLDAEGRLAIAAVDPDQGIAVSEGDSKIVVGDASGHVRDYGLSHFFGLNNLVVNGAGGSVGIVRRDIAADPFLLAAGKLSVNDGPPLSATLGGKGDQRGAALLAAALTSPTQTVARGALPAYGTTVGGYATDIASLSASLASEASRTRDGDQALVTDLEARIGTISGVNLDEELSRLILYQQAYTVSARIISITDDLFGELMQIAG